MSPKDISKLVDDYGTYIYGFCRKLTTNKEDADDLYQQTFLRALEMCTKIDENMNPKSLLVSISIKQWQNVVSKKSRHQKILPMEQNCSSEYLENVSSGHVLEDEVEKKVVLNEVTRIITCLPEKFRIPMIMFYNAELAVKEIAAVLKLPEGTVKSRLSKARSLVKKGLEEKGYEKL